MEEGSVKHDNDDTASHERTCVGPKPVFTSTQHAVIARVCTMTLGKGGTDRMYCATHPFHSAVSPSLATVFIKQLSIPV